MTARINTQGRVTIGGSGLSGRVCVTSFECCYLPCVLILHESSEPRRILNNDCEPNDFVQNLPIADPVNTLCLTLPHKK